jgi:hypothetical protein
VLSVFLQLESEVEINDAFMLEGNAAAQLNTAPVHAESFPYIILSNARRAM